ncbi:50S ribosomal protein L25 [Candidatus Beckwithbacteria bacterium CG23_combo_of_CG06-09_8_20_14_all_47_9]|uniref:Large ribosomal subunit protein bL25 n=5 Tax=Candidatus Beckwithiibacteriota TaxID=1752726 RepID=A0A2H0B4Q2_9BACT|nr:MAG: 50S ribosomal protein L25 [Candidatus Beckwithbacteria bacterium CG23_combo_of_CG06-09_8_20_14_all_47_9]
MTLLKSKGIIASMAQALKLTAQKRTLTGRKVKQLRRKQILPANIYGKDVKSLAIELPVKEFKSVLAQAGETNIINVSVDKEAKSRPVLVHHVQVDPVSDELLHADLRQVDLTKKVTVMVPLELKGASPAVAKGGVLVRLLNEVEIEALPSDLPDKLEVDITGLEEIGQSITLKQVPLDTVKVKLLTENPDELVVKIEAPAKEEEPVVAAAPVAEVAKEGEPPAAAKAPAGEEAKQPVPDQDKKPAPKKA